MRYIDILGIDWQFFEHPTPLNGFGRRKLSTFAHEYGFMVQPFAIKDDFLKFTKGISVIEEYQFFFEQGVDGVFTEFPKSAKLAFDYIARVGNMNACPASGGAGSKY